MLQEFQVNNIVETIENNDEIYQIMNHRMTYFSNNLIQINILKY